MRKLTRAEWEELDDQMSRTPWEVEGEGVPGEHMNLIVLLNPMSKQEAMKFASEES